MTKFTLSALLAAFLAVFGTSQLAAQRITVSVAGNGSDGFNGDGHPGHLTNITAPVDVCRDAANNIYFTDHGNGRIRKISGRTGMTTTVAGGGASSADGIPATDALLAPSNICIDNSGNLYIVNSASDIRKIDAATNLITTMATIPGSSIMGICVDATHNIYAGDMLSNKIWKVDAFTGIVNAIAGTGLVGYSGDGGPALLAALNRPGAICLNTAGEIVFADQIGSSVIRKISAAGTISTIAGTVSGGVLYNVPAMSAMLGYVTGICTDDTGNLFFNEISCSCRKIEQSSDSVFQVGGNFYTQSFNDNINANMADMNYPYGLCVAPHGTVYIADKVNNRIRKVIQLSPTPFFAFGEGQFITPCPGFAISIDTQMAITDLDAGQTETWTMLTAPVHGTLAGFPATASSVGVSHIVMPSGVSYLATGTYTGNDSFRVRVSDGLLSDTVTMYVSVQMGTPGAISGPGSVCMLSNVPVAATFPGGTWSMSNGHASIYPSPGFVTGITAGVDTIIYTLFTGCYIATTMVITINPLPAPATISGPANVCTGATIALTASLPSGIWNTLDPTIATISSVGIVTGISYGATSVMYSIYDGVCSASSYQVTNVDIVTPPIAASSDSVCIGSNLTLYDYVTAGIWSVSNGNAGVDSTGLLTGIAPGIDTISYTTINGCGTIAVSLPVFVNALPYPGIISGPSVMCAGTSATFTSTVLGGSWSAYSYYTYADPATGLVTASYPGIDSIIYMFSDGGACTAFIGVPVTVAGPPSAGEITGPDSVCLGAAITLADTISGGTWSVSGTGASVSGVGVVSGLAVGTPYIVYSVTNTCGTSDAMMYLSVIPLADAGTITGMSNVCVGAPLTLTDTSTGGTWSAVNYHASITTTGIVSGITAGVDSILYTVSNSCGTTTAVSVITINAAPDAGMITADVTTVCEGATAVLSDAITGGLWSEINGVCTVSGAGLVTGLLLGDDTIVYTVTNTCGTASARQAISVIHCSGVGLPETQKAGPIHIFPNPATSVINIAWGAAIGDATVMIQDVTGREIWRTNIDGSPINGAIQLMLSDIIEGIYMVTVRSESISYTQKLEISK